MCWPRPKSRGSAATLEEIIAAGIDPNDPDNQNIEAFEILVQGTLYRFYYNVNGLRGARSSSGDDGGGGGGGGNTGDCYRFSCSIDGSFSRGGKISVTISETLETITIMTIPVEASWLKEFFNVELAVFSNAETGFTFKGGSATLDIPGGLSLADTAVPQSLTVPMPNVPAGGEVYHTWMVRGDEAGEYPISATYRGTLEPTGLPIGPLVATTETPLKVWGLDAIDFLIEADDSLTRLSPYHVRVGMKNVSDVPVYNARIAYGESDGTDYWYQPEEDLVYTTQEIAPGETFWTDEVIVIDTDTSPFSYVGNVDVGIAGLAVDQFQVTELEPPPSGQPQRQQRSRTVSHSQWESGRWRSWLSDLRGGTRRSWVRRAACGRRARSNECESR